MQGSATERPGSLAITIDLEPESVGLRAGGSLALDRVSQWLFETLDAHGVRATWAVADPVHSAASEHLATKLGGHEIAVLGDARWVGVEAGRGRFARELARRFLSARAAGIDAATLVPRVAIDEGHLDLLMKYDVRAVCSASVEPRRTKWVSPRAVRYGVWRMPVQTAIPCGAKWGLSCGALLRHRVRGSARRGRVFHVMIRAAGLSESSARLLRSLEQLLRLAERLSELERLRIETLSEIADRLSEVPKAAPARSILRPAG